MGRQRVRQWGDPMAVPGEKPMAVDTRMRWADELRRSSAVRASFGLAVDGRSRVDVTRREFELLHRLGGDPRASSPERSSSAPSGTTAARQPTDRRYGCQVSGRKCAASRRPDGWTAPPQRRSCGGTPRRSGSERPGQRTDTAPSRSPKRPTPSSACGLMNVAADPSSRCSRPVRADGSAATPSSQRVATHAAAATSRRASLI